MTRKRTNRPAASSPSTPTLVKLRRLYTHQPPRQHDLFGRRAALPSEIAACLKPQKPGVSA
ncbi:MAG TPA: hypothetical protein GYA08_13905 [Chloroflexi bacterium]|nr:hypothetical protein [Chloroflexota bacterium]